MKNIIFFSLNNREVVKEIEIGLLGCIIPRKDELVYIGEIGHLVNLVKYDYDKEEVTIFLTK